MAELQDIYHLFNEIQTAMTASTWLDFLHTAGWNYKYPFQDQILIYAQKKDATACASMEVWNKLHREVTEHSHSIALLDDSGPQLALRYVFDVSDTFSVLDKPIPLWQMHSGNHDAILEALHAVFLPDAPSPDPANLTDFFRSLAFTIVDNEETQLRDTAHLIREHSPQLHHLSEDEIWQQFRTLLSNSMTVSMMARCGLECGLSQELFVDITQFRTLYAMAALGCNVQYLSRQALDHAALEAKAWEKHHKEESIHESKLSENRSLSGAGRHPTHPSSDESLRPDAQDLPAGEPSGGLYRPSDLRHSEQASEGDWGANGETDPDQDVQSLLHPGGESAGAPAPDSEQFGTPAPDSGGVHSSSDRIRITDDEFEKKEDASQYGLDVTFRTPEEQAVIARSEQAISLLTQEQKDAVLTHDFNGLVRRDLLSEILHDDPGSESVRSAISDIYKGISDDVTFLDGSSAHVEASENGLLVRIDDQLQFLSWNRIASRIQELVRMDRYHLQKEKDISQPVTSQQLAVGDEIILHGVRYHIQNISEHYITIQDSQHPLFQEHVPHAVLDLLLRNQQTYTFNNVSVPDNDGPVDENKPPAIEHSDHINQDENAESGTVSVYHLRDTVVSVLSGLYDTFYPLASPFQQDLPTPDELSDVLSEFRLETYQYYKSTLSEQEKEDNLRIPDDNGRTISAVLLRMRGSDETHQVESALEAMCQLYQIDEEDLSDLCKHALPAAYLPHPEHLFIPNLPMPDTAHAAPSELSGYSLHTLRLAISGLLSNDYDVFYHHASQQDPSLPTPKDLKIICNDFLQQSEPSGFIELSEQEQKDLRTLDHIGKALALTAFRMRAEQVNKGITDRSEIIVRSLCELYELEEASLLEQAQTSSWVAVQPPHPEPDSAPPASTVSEPQSEQPQQSSELSSETVPYALAPAKRNYKFMADYAPAILDGTLDYIRFESDGFEPLYIQRLWNGQLAMAHTFIQNGDTMLDPEIVFVVDSERQALYPVSYEQSDFSLYQSVYDNDDTEFRYPNKSLEKDLNSFLKTWMQNLKWQEHTPVRGIKFSNDGDVEYTFDENHNPIPKQPEPSEPVPAAKSGISISENAVRIGSQTITFAPKDVLVFDQDEFEIDKVENGQVYFHSLRDGKQAPAADLIPLANQVANGDLPTLVPAWNRPYSNSAPSYQREDQQVLANLLSHFDDWRTHIDIGFSGQYYAGIMDRMTNLRISEDMEENRRNIIYAAYTVHHFFPLPDSDVTRAENTSSYLNAADNFLNADPDLEEYGLAERRKEWQEGGEQNLYEDLRHALSEITQSEPSSIPEAYLSVSQSPDFYHAIPAIAGYLKQHRPDSFQTQNEQFTFEQLLRAAKHYEDDRSTLYPNRSEDTPQREASVTPVPEAKHIPEPYIDHPELIRKDLSQLGRRDKVVLTNLLVHYEDYRYKFRENMPELDDTYRQEYETDWQRMDDILVSEDPAINLTNIQFASDFIQKWFVTFSDGISEQILNVQMQYLKDAEALSQATPETLLAEDSAPSEFISSEQHFNPSYMNEILCYGDEDDDFPTRLSVFLSANPDQDDRLDYLREHFGKVYTSFYAQDGNIIGFHGAPDHLEVWEKNYLTSKVREKLSWPDVLKRLEELIADRQANSPEVQEEDGPSLFDFEIEPSQPSPVAVQAAPQEDAQGRINFRVSDLTPHYGGPKTRFANNLEAIRVLKQIEGEDRLATPEEQQVLHKYVGWGGLPQAFDPDNQQWQEEYQQLRSLLSDDEFAAARKSSLTAFYTPPVVTQAIFECLGTLGLQKGNLLDPCCGTGAFFGSIPEDMSQLKLHGVELDDISGRIARQLYQQANIIIDGYENVRIPDNLYDAAVGNVPFGNFSLSDRRYDKEHFQIHDYFVAKTLDKVRPGGVVALITSKGTMDKKSESVRRYIAQRADLLGAIRLPDNTFQENAGTDVVSDILFLQKRERPIIQEPSWVGLDYLTDPGSGEVIGSVNSYFVEHPEMILGDMVEVSGPHGPQLTCRARAGEDLQSELHRAISNITGNIELSLEEVEEGEVAEQRKSIEADPSVRNFSYAVLDGDIYFREDSRMYQCNLSRMATKRVKGMVELRDTLRDLIDAQVQGEDDEIILNLQRQLNDQYDAYTKKYGLINSRGNSIAFSEDSSYYLLCSLEHVDDEGNFLGKADIFYKRTIGTQEPITHTETAHEALAVSMSERARVDIDFISQLCGQSREEVIEHLAGAIFPIPDTQDEYELSSLYLSGNVREKLEDAREAAKEDPRFLSNVEALEKVLPEPLGPDVISVRLGTPWIPPEDITLFMQELLNPSYFARDRIKAIHSAYNNTWCITNKAWDNGNERVRTTYGTQSANAYDLIEDALNNRDTQIYDTKYIDGTSRRVLNQEATIEAQEKQRQIQDAFKEWIWKDPERRDRLCQIYNETFNSIVPPSYDENLVAYHGMNPTIQLAPHQKESVARIIYGGNTQLAHSVGAGKTWTMVAAAMEMKHLGLCRKSMVVVPNHLVGQWASAIYQLYPAANVLASTAKDFEKKNRKKFCSRIATGDYDIVVIGHSQFERIPLSIERQEHGIQTQIDEILDVIQSLKDEKAESFTIKQMEAAKARLNTRLDKLNNNKKRDDVINFEQLGIDRLFVDESHEYKNLFHFSKMRNVAGISQTESQKAFDMFLKCRYMDELTGNKGNIHATGTPISNTMAELYTHQRYLQYDVLEKMGLGSFDAWAGCFGETIQSYELAPEGQGFRQRTRFAKFFNVPELMNLYKLVADIRTNEVLNLPLPTPHYDVVSLPATEEQKSIVAQFCARAARIRNGAVRPDEDNMLCVTNDGRKLALDQRLIDPTLPDNPNSKANACADLVWQRYKEGEAEQLTQLVFCDLGTPKGKGEFSVYHDLKEKLMARGIPANEIRFIHEAHTEAQKEAIFAKVRSGEIRVLMGSTGKLGTGTNVQDRLIASYDLDCPYRPSDLEQRAGRVVRRGNNNQDVYITRFVTEGSFDSYLYQLLKSKSRFINQVFTNKDPARIVADMDEVTLSYAEIMALATGNPKIMEKVELEGEVSRLKMLKSSHEHQQYRLDYLIRHTYPENIQELQSRLKRLEADKQTVEGTPKYTDKGALVPVCVNGRYFKTASETGSALLNALDQLPIDDQWHTIATLRGFELQGKQSCTYFGKSIGHLSINGSGRYEVFYNLSPVGTLQKIHNLMDEIPERYIGCVDSLENAKRQLELAKQEYGKPFPSEAKLSEFMVRLEALEKELDLDAEKAGDESLRLVEEGEQRPNLSETPDINELEKGSDVLPSSQTQSLAAIIHSAQQSQNLFSSSSPTWIKPSEVSEEHIRA